MSALKGTWANHNLDLIYQVIPKCACSTIGQVLYHVDHGKFFDGDIHDAGTGVWRAENHDEQTLSTETLRKTIDGKDALSFTCVRNPWARLVSCFLDKFCRRQRGGGYYRGDMVQSVAKEYGMDLSEGFDQIKAFRKFVLFARDTLKFGHPMAPDIHWEPVSSHCRHLLRVGGRFDMVFPIEDFSAGMATVLERAGLSDRVDLDRLPRFNDTAEHDPRQAHPVAEYYDELTAHLVRQTYWWDFKLFNYHHLPDEGPPLTPIDPDAVNQWYAEAP